MGRLCLSAAAGLPGLGDSWARGGRLRQVWEYGQAEWDFSLEMSSKGQPVVPPRKKSVKEGNSPARSDLPGILSTDLHTQSGSSGQNGGLSVVIPGYLLEKHQLALETWP